jgi:putative PIN family toxin of toxin-antitoxin system
VIVVFDTNIYISAFQYGGISVAVMRQAFLFDDLVVCEEIGTEIVRVMQNKFRREPVETARLLADAWRQARFVTISGSLTGVCRDANDDFILECAILGQAGIIVTGDEDLLSIDNYEGIRIMTPRQYLDNAAKSQD